MIFDARARHSGSLTLHCYPLTGAPGQPHSSDLLAASHLREDAGGGRLQHLPLAGVCAGRLRRPSSAAACGGRLRRPPVAAACGGRLRRPPAAAARGGRLCFWRPPAAAAEAASVDGRLRVTSAAAAFSGCLWRPPAAAACVGRLRRPPGRSLQESSNPKIQKPETKEPEHRKCKT